MKAPLIKVNTLADLKLVKREIEEQAKVQAEAAAQQAARHKRLQAGARLAKGGGERRSRLAWLARWLILLAELQ